MWKDACVLTLQDMRVVIDFMSYLVIGISDIFPLFTQFLPANFSLSLGSNTSLLRYATAFDSLSLFLTIQGEGEIRGSPLEIFSLSQMV